MVQIPRRGQVGQDARRARPTRLASGADVPQVSPTVARDPGVRTSPEQFGALEGGAVEGLGAQAGADTEKLFQAEKRIQKRQAGLARDSDDTAYAEALSERLRELEATADLSRQEVIEEAAKFAREQQAEIINNHTGGEESRAVLQNRLERRRVSFTDTLAAKNIAAAEDRLNQSVSRRLSAITAEVSQDPDVLLAEDPAEVFRKHVGVLEDEIDFLELSPPQARAVRQAGQQEIAKTMIEPLIREGDFERARTLLRDDSLEEAIEPGTRRDMVRRINQVEREAFQGRAEGTQALDTARTILGPGASEEDVRAAAAEMAGISAQQNLEFFKVGNNVVAVNRQTGALVGRIEGEPPEQEAERAGQVERAKLMARREVINRILADAGAGPIEVPTGEGERAQESSAVVQPFGEGEEASEDAQAASRLFLASRRLLLAGETQMANSLLGQARFIVENSSDIQRSRELDKPISPDLAAELGVSIGTTLRDVIGVLPRSPEEQAESRAAASERGRQRVGGEEQIAFIDEARTVINDLLEEVEEDPGIVGARGSLRSTGQTAVQVLGDLGFRQLANEAREVAFENTDLGLNDIAGMFDSPTLSTLDIMENTLGLILARLRTPTGRIPVDVIRRSVDDVQLTGLQSSEQVQNRLNFVLEQLDRRAEGISERFGIGQQDAGGAEDTEGLPRFRIENGNLVPMEGGAGGGTQAPLGDQSLLDETGRVEPQSFVASIEGAGLPREAAIGFAGNIQQESNFDPNAVGDNGNAFGLFQHNGPRAKALFDFAREQGEDVPELTLSGNKVQEDLQELVAEGRVPSPGTQVAFALHELETTERKAAEAIRNASSPEEAARIISRRFFRPGDAREKNRVRFARQIAQKARG